ncbi:MAG: retropepsin-like aspartic protease [Candidatus Zixiibacteriota bacterium]
MRIIMKIIGLIIISILAFAELPATEINDLIPDNDIARAAQMISFVGRGTAVMGGMTGRFEIQFLAPDNLYLSIDLGILKISQGFDGKTAWIRDQNNQTMELEGAEKKQIINTAYISSFSYLLKDRMPGEVVYSRDSTIDNIDYSIFNVFPMGGDSVLIYINKNTKRLEIYREQLDDISIITYASDFQDVSGIEVPFTLKALANNPQLNSSMVYEEMMINEPVDKRIFLKSGEDFVDYFYPADVKAITIPFSYYNGHIYIEGSVDGQPGRFILDSGAGANVIDRAFAEKIGLEKTGDLPSKGVTGYGTASLTEIDSIQLAEISLYDQVVTIVDFNVSGLIANEHFAGILGYDLLSRFPFKVNFSDSTLIFYNPKLFTPPADDYAIDIEFVMKVPTITASYDGHPGKFLIDFGNSLGLILHSSFIDKYNLKETFTDTMTMTGGIGGIGGSSSAIAAVGGDFEFGPVVIEKTALIYADSKEGITQSVILDGNIGTLILKDFSILLDYERKKIYVLPPETE